MIEETFEHNNLGSSMSKRRENLILVKSWTNTSLN